MVKGQREERKEEEKKKKKEKKISVENVLFVCLVKKIWGKRYKHQNYEILNYFYNWKLPCVNKHDESKKNWVVSVDMWVLLVE